MESSKNKRQHLDAKISSTFALILLVLGLLQTILISVVSLISYNQLETQNSYIDLQRILAAVEDEKERMLELAREFGAWDDTRQFVLGEHPEYPEDNFTTQWYDEAKISMLVFTRGEQVAWSWISPGDAVLQVGSIVPGIEKLASNETAVAWDSGRHGLMLVVAWPITSSDFSAEPVGWVIMARSYLGELQSRLARRTGLDLELAEAASLGYADTALEANHPPRFFDRGRRRVFSIPAANRHGNILAILEFSRIKPLNAILYRLIGMLTFLILASTSIVALILRQEMRKLVIKPLELVTDFLQAREKGMTRSLPLNLGKNTGREDEIGLVADNIDALLETLSRRQQDLELANLRLEEQASIDPLTGLANRRRFENHINFEVRRLARMHRQTEPVFVSSVLLCDLDHFKLYNDRYGHQAGDDCLRVIANAINESLHRPGDLACRYGGEEFIVMLPGTGLDGAAIVAANIMKAVEQLNIPHEDSFTASWVTLSIGIACTQDPDDSEELAATIERADQALYQAKKAGRNRIVCAPPCSSIAGREVPQPADSPKKSDCD